MSSLFVPPAVQVENIRRASASREWFFTPGELEAAAARAPEWPKDAHRALVLVPYFDVALTFEELWDVVVGTYPVTSRDHTVVTSHGRLRYAEHNAIVPTGKCLQWEVIHLDDCAFEVAPSPQASHAGVLAVFAHHPEWALAVAGAAPIRFLLRGYSIVPTGVRDAPAYAPAIVWRTDHRGKSCLHLTVAPVKPSCGWDRTLVTEASVAIPFTM